MVVNSKVSLHGDLDDKESACNVGDPGLVPWVTVKHMYYVLYIFIHSQMEKSLKRKHNLHIGRTHHQVCTEI